ncbi:hypothetical protein HYU18_03510 [Candidatus Woesearchaeota archaeon]|nr:hypothetical protein [Candidatus Woesearchaeota archaeon]
MGQGGNKRVVHSSPRARTTIPLPDVSRYVTRNALLNAAVEEFKNYVQTGSEESKRVAEAVTKKLDQILTGGEPDGAPQVIPIGRTHSGGDGYWIPLPINLYRLPRIMEEIAREAPVRALGYRRLQQPAAEAAANAFSHIENKRRELDEHIKKVKTTGSKSLDKLLQTAFIAIPDPIMEMAVVGPIKLQSGLAAVIQSRVGGPSLNDQWNAVVNHRIAANGGKDMTTEGWKASVAGAKQYGDARLWAVAQATAVWQVIAPLTLPGDAEYRLRRYYSDMIHSTFLEFASITGIKLSQSDTDELRRFAGEVGSRLEMTADNIVPYFDAAHRNFIDEHHNNKARAKDSYAAIVKNGEIDFTSLFELQRRIDLSHLADRPFALAQEDDAHNTENAFARVPPESRSRYNAGRLLAAQALFAYNMGRGDVEEAARIAEERDEIWEGGKKPEQSERWRRYDAAHPLANAAMPTIRKIRQGILAVHYTRKARRDQELGLTTRSGYLDDITRQIEASAYLSRAWREWPEFMSALRIGNGTRIYGLTSYLLNGAAQVVKAKQLTLEQQAAKGQTA